MELVPQTKKENEQMFTKDVDLNSDEVRETRVRFELNRQVPNAKFALPFNEFLRRVCKGSTDASIARSADVSKARVAALRRKYLEPLIGRMTPKERTRIRRALRRNEKQKQRPRRPELRAVTRRAELYRCSVKQVVSNGTVLTKHLEINGAFCRIYWTGKVHQLNKKRYSRFSVTRSVLEEIDAVIFYERLTASHRFFVVQSSDLHAAIPREVEQKYIYVPLEKRRTIYNNKHPDIDLLDYQDKWRLLSFTTTYDE